MSSTHTLRVATWVAVASLFAFAGCDEKKAEPPPPTPIAAPPPAAPPPAAEPVAAPHAAQPADKAPAEAKKDALETPPIAPPAAVEAPADVKDKAAKGMEANELPTTKKGGKPLPPPPPPAAEAPTAAPAREGVPTGGRPGRGIPAAFGEGPKADAGK